MSWWFSGLSLLLLVSHSRGGKAEDAPPPKKWAFFDPILDPYDVQSLQPGQVEGSALQAVLQSVVFASELWLRQERIKGLNGTHATFLVDSIPSPGKPQTTVESTFELSKLDGTVYGKAVRWPEGFAQAIKKIMGADPVSVPEALQMLTGQEPVKLYDCHEAALMTRRTSFALRPFLRPTFAPDRAILVPHERSSFMH
ncbi:hypothetical protein DB88DRAFT_473321 [Papiliotrema laurentii]|uniref:Amine oxidase n=1 Tax=Papiliotrema laurentii TaxID=5418 RepID=A0AAD9FQL6_PAPLA|nr:hypothetical protein DB88DRAFT_473321 [Papiliotrema laurentii]